MTRKELIGLIRKRKSFLCVGLDTDIQKIPPHLRRYEDAVLTFNKAIIDATRDYCVSYKINTAFYEVYGAAGWEIMEKTVHYIGKDHFIIADAKRGDIGNTSDQYARAFFETLDCDAVTIAPYMGEDSVRPFLNYPGKWAIVLGLTSNKGSEDFQQLRIAETNEPLYTSVLRKVASWGTAENTMFVIGATQSKDFESIRALLPDHFFLVPGVGAQGGSIEDIKQKAMSKDIGLLVNASRSIIYASQGEDYAEAAMEEAKKMVVDLEIC